MTQTFTMGQTILAVAVLISITILGVSGILTETAIVSILGAVVGVAAGIPTGRAIEYQKRNGQNGGN